MSPQVDYLITNYIYATAWQHATERVLRTCDYNENIYNFSEYSAEIIWKENLIFCLLYVPKGHIFQLAEIEIEYQLGVKHVCILEIPMKLCTLKTLMIWTTVRGYPTTSIIKYKMELIYSYNGFTAICYWRQMNFQLQNKIKIMNCKDLLSNHFIWVNFHAYISI